MLQLPRAAVVPEAEEQPDGRLRGARGEAEGHCDPNGEAGQHLHLRVGTAPGADRDVVEGGQPDPERRGRRQAGGPPQVRGEEGDPLHRLR